MQVSVETTESPLGRSVTVEVPEERISAEVDKRLESMTRTTRVQGFRPGKAPLRVIKQRFATQVRREVVDKILRSSFNEAIARENLKPIGAPMIAPLQADSGKGLSYTAKFEVMPEIKLNPVEKLEFEKPACDINDDDAKRMIEKLRGQRRQLQQVERAAKEGDVVNIDYKGLVGGEIFEGGEAEGLQVEIGMERLIPGFETGLIGASADETVSLDLNFPEGYHKEELAGKPVTFEIRVNSVSEPVLPELNEEFFQAFGVTEGGEEAFHREIHRHMGWEAEVAARSRFRDSIMQALYDANKIELPNVLVDAEIHRMQHQLVDNMKARGLSVEDSRKATELPMFEEPARRRVALQLLVGEIVRSQGLTAKPEKVREIIEKNAQSYEDSSGIINWYYNDKERLAEVEAIALEDEVIDWVAAQGKVKKVSLSFDELVNKGQTGGDGN